MRNKNSIVASYNIKMFNVCGTDIADGIKVVVVGDKHRKTGDAGSNECFIENVCLCKACLVSVSWMLCVCW